MTSSLDLSTKGRASGNPLTMLSFGGAFSSPSISILPGGSYRVSKKITKLEWKNDFIICHLNVSELIRDYKDIQVIVSNKVEYEYPCVVPIGNKGEFIVLSVAPIGMRNINDFNCFANIYTDSKIFFEKSMSISMPYSEDIFEYNNNKFKVYLPKD